MALTRIGKFEESKHPRNKGKFASKPGSGAKSKIGTKKQTKIPAPASGIRKSSMDSGKTSRIGGLVVHWPAAKYDETFPNSVSHLIAFYNAEGKKVADRELKGHNTTEALKAAVEWAKTWNKNNGKTLAARWKVKHVSLPRRYETA